MQFSQPQFVVFGFSPSSAPDKAGSVRFVNELCFYCALKPVKKSPVRRHLNSTLEHYISHPTLQCNPAL